MLCSNCLAGGTRVFWDFVESEEGSWVSGQLNFCILMTGLAEDQFYNIAFEK